MDEKIKVLYEATPNPQSLKFNCTALISEESIHFDDPLKAERSPLAKKLFGFPWAQAIFIGPNFVTLTKENWVDWEVIADPLSQLIEEHVNGGEPVLLPQDSLADTSNDSPIVKQIKDILNREIRPAVAMDGGDIVFFKYENNIVYLHMQGSCSGCPSSTITLKQGIETRLKEALPEIQEVVSV